VRRVRPRLPAPRTATRLPWGRRVFGVVLAATVFLWTWEIVGHTLYATRGTSDVGFYQVDALRVRGSGVPYRDFAVDYPPGALAAFLAPMVAADPADAHDYDVWFSRAMGALGVLCVLLAGLVSRRLLPLGFLAVSPLLIGSLALTRFDLWPAALTLGAVVALVHDRHRVGWALLGAAIATKIYPLVLIPLAAIWTFRRRGSRELGRAAAVGAGVMALLFGPFATVVPRGFWESLWGQASRPLEIESLPAAFVKTFGHPEIISAKGALAIAGHDGLAVASTVTALVALSALWLSFWHGESDRDRFLRYGAACVCTFIAFGKVLSPQYLIWLVPLVPLVAGIRGTIATGILAGAFVCTDIVWYGAHSFTDYAFGSDWAWLVLTRDLLLVALVAVLALQPQVIPGRRA
jgi:Glycosyltransferase family 87